MIAPREQSEASQDMPEVIVTYIFSFFVSKNQNQGARRLESKVPPQATLLDLFGDEFNAHIVM